MRLRTIPAPRLKPGQEEAKLSANQRIEGDMQCDAGFLVLPECLNQSFESRAACFPLSIRLPRLDQEHDVYNLLAPFSEIRADKDDQDAADARYPGDSEWGCLQSWRDPASGENSPTPASALVERLRFITEGSVDSDDDFQNTRDHIRRHQAEWWTRLADWIGVISSQDLVELGKQRRTRRSFEQVLMWIADSADGREPGFSSLVIPEIRPYCGNPLSYGELARCMSLVAQSKRPPDEWLLIRDARSLLRSGEYRRAVLDAGTAAELAITTLIDRHVLANSTADIATALTKRVRMLGALRELAFELIPELLPDHLLERVIRPRNSAAHKGEPLTFEVADAAIATTTELLQTVHPMTEFGFAS